ncbi:MAG: hypothetical protein AMXMBFR13_08470 [Phycisphaerae bacterium]
MQTRTVTFCTHGAVAAAWLLLAMPAQAANDAQVAGSTIPAAINPGYTADVEVTLRNTGTTTWVDKEDYNLGDQGSSGLAVPGRIRTPGGAGVPPGSTHTFRFSIRAPVTAGTYTTRWKMVQEHVEWFGETHTRDIVVGYGPDVPTTPAMTWPLPNATVGSNRPDITWAPVPHDAYEVHICLQNDPNALTGGWSSGVQYVSQVTTTAMSGPLAPGTWYYAFVRLHNPNGWSAWTPGRRFYVAGEFLNEPYWVGDDVGSQWPHTLCYNPDRNEYLLAYTDKRPEEKWRISYYVLDGAGQRSSPKVSILDDPWDGAGEAAVAYDSGSREYLITYAGWQRIGTTDYSSLRGQKVDAPTGGLKGASYLLFDSFGAIYEHRMAYSPISDVYLVTWKDISGQSEVFATRVSGVTGQRVGGVINLTADENRYSAFPLLAWNSARDEFLVVYQVSAEEIGQSWNLYSGRISAPTGSKSPAVQITDGTAAEFNGDLAYDADLDRYLLLYEARESGVAIWGQFLTGDGAPAGPRFAVLQSPDSGGSVWLAWHPNTRDFLAGWLDCCSYGDYGRRISQVGVPLGERFKITGDLQGIGNWKPVPVANTASNDWLFAWFNSYNDVWTRRYKAHPMLDATPPAPVTGFSTTPGHGQIELRWTTSTSADSLGTIIRYKTNDYPTGPHDGEPVAVRPRVPNLADSFIHEGLHRAKTYYYAAFAYDAIPNHAPAAQAMGRPLAPADLDSDQDVDLDDFGRFQTCLSGSGQPLLPDCTDADLDGDFQVDQADMSIFRSCMGGANQPPEC